MARLCEKLDGGVYWVPALAALGRDDSGAVHSQRYAGPSLGAGAGVCPYSLSLFVPRMRGMARLKAHGLDFARPARFFCRASPERRALALMTRAPAPCGAPPRHRLAFAFHGSRTRRRLSTHGGLPESRPGTWLRATPAGAASRPTLMTPHESAPQWTRRAKQTMNFTLGQYENRK
jgi:hypothetical protein